MAQLVRGYVKGDISLYLPRSNKGSGSSKLQLILCFYYNMCKEGVWSLCLRRVAEEGRGFLYLKFRWRLVGVG